MNNLRSIRIFLSTLFLASAVAYVAVGLTHNPMLGMVRNTQIILSCLGASVGAVLFWLLVTLFLGRVYCSSVCPVGTIQDLVIGLRRRLPGSKPLFRYKKPSRVRWIVLAAYLVFLALGLSLLLLIWEPWNMYCNIASISDSATAEANWQHLGLTSGSGFLLAGIFSLPLLLFSAAFMGRDYCNVACPVGIGLGAVSNISLYQIRIDPDRCINCMKCEEGCKAGCIKVVERHVDNSRCVRCFDCISVCPNDAIRLTNTRFRAATPLMNRTT